jgi:hypothetical protein
VVPLPMLALFSWYDLELLVCGNPVIDVEALRRHTVYNVRKRERARRRTGAKFGDGV